MCGIVGCVGPHWRREQLEAMVSVQQHRGPDDSGIFINEKDGVGLGHTRLRIIDLSDAGHQPMSNDDGTLWIVFNGEIYNYIELRSELADYPYWSATDTEVILAAYERWGEGCVDHFIGMFAFLIWDSQKQTLFAARDRFGVKPLYYATLPAGQLAIASEIKALHRAGLPQEPHLTTWATYLTYGLYDHNDQTFWQDVHALGPGHALRWHKGQHRIWQWYDLAERVGHTWDTRSENEVIHHYRSLLEESIRLRFRSDVPVGINLSGGLDSSTLLGLVHAVQGTESEVVAFTFITGDERYDELPWVQQMLHTTQHPHHICRLSPADVPDLAARVQWHEEAPFGGLPTLAYAKLFERARELGIIVLLDGQGLDEQWAGYDYYARAVNGSPVPANQPVLGPVQSSQSRSVRPECLLPAFRCLAEPWTAATPFPDALRNVQYRDARYAKIPRALRFNDRISMMHSTELREPFLDHRLFEVAFSQPAERKIRNGTHKWLLRRITPDLLPKGVVEAPKRPLQTPQREWLRGPLEGWAEDCIEHALSAYGGVWLDADRVRGEWKAYQAGASDNSFYIWQWISVGLMQEAVSTQPC